MIYYTNIKTQLGNLGLVRDEDSLLRIYLPNEEISEPKCGVAKKATPETLPKNSCAAGLVV